MLSLSHAPPQPTPSPARAAQAPPDTEISRADEDRERRHRVGPAVNITNNPGYDNQPFFTPDGTAILFTSVRGGPAATGGRDPDRHLPYDIARSEIAQVTTDARERVLADGDARRDALSVIRVELDGQQHAAAVAVHADGARSAARARERQAGRLPRVGRRPYAGALALRRSASPRRCSSPTRAPARRACIALGHRPIDSADPRPDVGRRQHQLRAARAQRRRRRARDQEAEPGDRRDLGADAGGRGRRKPTPRGRRTARC